MDFKSNSAVQSVLVVYSGGLDSTVALHQVVKDYGASNVQAISFAYGANHNARELVYARLYSERLGVPWQVRDIGRCFGGDSALLAGASAVPDGHYAHDSMKKTVVPLRNGIMLMVAGSLAESLGLQGVAIGAHAGDHAIYPDCRPPFMEAMAQALRQGTYSNVALLRPLLHLSKAAIVTRGTALGVDFSRTYSCYKGRVAHCGRCGTCTERAMAFNQAGLSDPTPYEDETYWRTVAAPQTP